MGHRNVSALLSQNYMRVSCICETKVSSREIRKEHLKLLSQNQHGGRDQTAKHDHKSD